MDLLDEQKRGRVFDVRLTANGNFLYGFGS